MRAELQNVRRKPRADGERNRAAILEAARRIFGERGSEVSLDAIAQAAGVGNGTLYRHFPTRGALIDAVCSDDARGLIAAAADLARDHLPLAALLLWLDFFIDHIAAKNVVVEAISALVVPATSDEGVSGAEVRSAFVGLFDQVVKGGEIKVEFDPLNLLRAVSGLSLVNADSVWADDAKHLVRVLVSGLREPLPTI
ncbi:transcriptional regulator, TetR family [Sphingobium sp. AP50]|uniref:TetR/AcrR family transcriptional regulator n=1 Tax=Sphingobium sp. AP50 TaxID=1884369 RepID=UPI0008D40269|nr:TetR/AcrR family transcriptional regulator [Sphingobium sp. AP50]SEK00824.1 transcriptional regulator, TetR family [Sphingobium sp. AP50]